MVVEVLYHAKALEAQGWADTATFEKDRARWLRVRDGWLELLGKVEHDRSVDRLRERTLEPLP